MGCDCPSGGAASARSARLSDLATKKATRLANAGIKIPPKKVSPKKVAPKRVSAKKVKPCRCK